MTTGWWASTRLVPWTPKSFSHLDCLRSIVNHWNKHRIIQGQHKNDSTAHGYNQATFLDGIEDEVDQPDRPAAVRGGGKRTKTRTPYPRHVATAHRVVLRAWMGGAGTCLSAAFGTTVSPVNAALIPGPEQCEVECGAMVNAMAARAANGTPLYGGKNSSVCMRARQAAVLLGLRAARDLDAPLHH